MPVLQLVQAGTSRAAWALSSRGLSQADLAMQVVLPETDGRLLTTAVSFKERDETGRARLVPDPDGIALAADRAAGWARLARTPAAERRIAIILSDYPGAEGHEVGHAVGLDSLASVAAIHNRLAVAGYDSGNITVAVQPDRAPGADRRSVYHDPAAPPSDTYVAFYRWLTGGGGHPRDDPPRHAWHAGVAAGQGGGALVRLLASGADARAAGDLPLHRQQSRRGRARQAPPRRGHHRPYDAAAAARWGLGPRRRAGAG